MARVILVALAAVLTTGCSLQLKGFTCQAATSCGIGYSCVEGACAAPDSTCASNLRWDDTAGSRRGQCTPAASNDLSMRVDQLVSDFTMVDDAGDFSAGDFSRMSVPDLATGVVCGTNALCEDFEGASQPLWGENSQNAMGVIDTTRHYKGTHAFHVTIASSNATTPIITEVTYHLENDFFFTGGKTEAWARFYFYIMSPLPVDFSHFFWLQQSSGAFGQLQGVLTPSVLGIYSFLPDSKNLYTNTTTPIPTDQWVCVEFHLSAANPGVAQLAINGVLLQQTLSANFTDSPEPGLFALAWGGMAGSEDPASHQLWYDDVVLSTTRVGCAF